MALKSFDALFHEFALRLKNCNILNVHITHQNSSRSNIVVSQNKKSFIELVPMVAIGVGTVVLSGLRPCLKELLPELSFEAIRISKTRSILRAENIFQFHTSR